ncbi:MAG: hypothetical protein R3E95_11850 [Thiolinea sp.]
MWSGALIDDAMDLCRFALLITWDWRAAALLLASSRNIVMLFLGILLLRHLGQGADGHDQRHHHVVRYLDHHK